MKRLSLILITAGAILMLFPIAREYYYDWEQQQLLNEMEDSSLPINNELTNKHVATEYEQLSSIFNGSAEESSPDQTSITDMNDKAIAVITIDKIDLKLAVLEGATLKNMKVGAAHMTETAPLGEIGNAAIAAHRARTKGRQFNRLNEMEVGDDISIRTKDSTLIYTVDKISVVKPTDLSVLEGNNKDAILTLITCEPLVNPTHRLIVHAKMVK
ncbi:class D sortase [Cohnella sp. WQ 127256]|uniref:class D sortase n=1 Tax=Cohnella sp. WQ 127256 TaxID=2938790 RepID=UPI0021191362|nr:class D sortase [Cohnella sp. WQ 127256]